LRAHVDGCTRADGQLFMAGDEVGVQMSLEDVADGEALVRSGLQIQLDIALGIDHYGFAFRSQQVGSVRQTTQIKLFEIHERSPQRRAV
jgi:hypothetical protein